jgi:hypothetical protein
LLCGCRCRLEADNHGDLCELLRNHLRREHPTVRFTDEHVEEIVATRAYRHQCVEVSHANGSGPDEEFGVEPY